jgi:hypothetical protein
MIRGEAIVNLSGGGILTMAFGFRALAMAAAELRIPVDEMLPILSNDDGRGLLVSMTLMHASLRKYHPDLDMAQFDELMVTDKENFVDAFNRGMEGFSSPEPADGAASAEGKVPDGISTPSKKIGRKQG